MFGSRCERLTAATILSLGQGRTLIGCGASALSPLSRKRSALLPTIPRHKMPCAGAHMIPASGTPPRTTATLTVYSSRPAKNSRVPSSGSTRKKQSPSGATPASTLSSDTTGTFGASAASSRKITSSEAMSAAVTGEPSGFVSWTTSPLLIVSIAADARATMPVRSSSNLATSSGVRSRSGVNVRSLGRNPWRFCGCGVSRLGALFERFASCVSLAFVRNWRLDYGRRCS